jgi:hypothetical protein
MLPAGDGLLPPAAAEMFRRMAMMLQLMADRRG